MELANVADIDGDDLDKFVFWMTGPGYGEGHMYLIECVYRGPGFR